MIRRNDVSLRNVWRKRKDEVDARPVKRLFLLFGFVFAYGSSSVAPAAVGTPDGAFEGGTEDAGTPTPDGGSATRSCDPYGVREPAPEVLVGAEAKTILVDGDADGAHALILSGNLND